MTHCPGCDERDEQIRQLERELYGTDWYPPDELHLSHTEAAMLQAFMASRDRFLTRDFLLDARRAAVRHLKEDPDPKLIDVKLSHLRTKLRRFDMALETKWGFGWRLHVDSRHRLLNWTTKRAA